MEPMKIIRRRTNANVESVSIASCKPFALLDPCHRPQLDGFVVKLLKRISEEHDISYQALMNMYMNVDIDCTSARGEKQSSTTSLTLEYVEIDNGEYLYDIKTHALYTFSDSPQKIGFYNCDTDTITFDRC